jgi:hypothetical protein
MIKIKNRSYHKVLPDDIIVHRPSPLGNPYTHKHGTLARIVVATRDEAVDSYERWLREKIRVRDHAVCNALNEIYRKAKAGDISLVCFCSPARCHADVIRKVIEEKLGVVV